MATLRMTYLYVDIDVPDIATTEVNGCEFDVN